MTAILTDEERAKLVALEKAATPGPWLIGQGADGYPIIHTAPDSFSPSGQGIAHICKRAMCQDHTANARLIAASPDLVEALKAAHRTLLSASRGGETPQELNAAARKARAALSKAGV